jgi:imidazolonepropionase
MDPATAHARRTGAIDLLIEGAAELATPTGSSPCGGAALGRLSVLPHAALAIDAGRIVAVGSESDLTGRFQPSRRIDARGGTLVPGFVDAHTHPVFAGTREDEFEARSRGASYLEIAAAGGGILSTVRGVRAASDEQLLARLLLHLDRFLEAGTTTIEAKTGYGLTLRDELRCLEALAAAGRSHAVHVVPTFLGAHEVPEEFRGRKAGYVALVEGEMLPAVAERGLARYFDAFVESHVFGLEDARRMGRRARELGLGVRLHVDQLTPLGGAELAAELGAASADHLEHVSDAGIAALAAAGVVPVLCPVVPLYLRQTQEAPARRMVASGLAPALSTDFNPGSCYLQSLPETLCWAALRYGFSAAEGLTAATLNAACSLGLGSEIGSLEVGKRADVVVLDVPNHKHLVYELGRNPVRHVIANGRVAWSREPRE